MLGPMRDGREIALNPHKEVERLRKENAELRRCLRELMALSREASPNLRKTFEQAYGFAEAALSE